MLTHREIGSKTVITSRGKVGKIAAMVADVQEIDFAEGLGWISGRGEM